MNERQTPVRRTVNAGSNPQILDAAYLNADVNLATGTQLFYIDTGLDTLVTTSNPNAGALTTVGALGVNANGFLGFDIATDALGFNIAYASLRVGGVDGLCTIDLGNGSAAHALQCVLGQYGARTCSVSVHAACRCIRRAPVRGLKVP